MIRTSVGLDPAKTGLSARCSAFIQRCASGGERRAKPLARELERIALSAWRAVGGKGYGRADFRIDRTGQPWLLEVNPNPDISPTAGLARMAGVAGMDYTALVRTICEIALEHPAVNAAELWPRALLLSGTSWS